MDTGITALADMYGGCACETFLLTATGCLTVTGTFAGTGAAFLLTYTVGLVPLGASIPGMSAYPGFFIQGPACLGVTRAG